MKALKTGEKRTIKLEFSKIKVVAICVDSETPYIEIHDHERSILLTDVDAVAVIKGLEKALSILPSSK